MVEMTENGDYPILVEYININIKYKNLMDLMIVYGGVTTGYYGYYRLLCGGLGYFIFK